MANTLSNMLPLGSRAADFELLDTISDKKISLKELKGNKGTVVFFICNHCPFVIHVNKELVMIANAYESKGIYFIAISSNDVENYPQDGPLLMKETARQYSYSFPYLYDETQEVAKAYDAACTPDTYLFDENLNLVYRGQIDDSRPGNDLPVSGSDLRNAIEHLLNNKGIVKNQKPSIGCNIKWKQLI